MFALISRKHTVLLLVALLAIALVAFAVVNVSQAVPDADSGGQGLGNIDPYSGSFSTNFPVEVPVFHGLEPKLSLAYDSSGGNGWVGQGWTLTGLSIIERASLGRGGPRYDATDIFLLDGVELLACNPSPCTTFGGTHRPRTENYNRIQFDQTAYSNNGAWYIWDTDGTKSTYAPLYDVGNNRIFRYALKTVQDTHQLTTTYNYWCDPGKTCYLDNISYNGTVISFKREARPDSITFANGVYIGAANYRLKTIDVTTGGNHVRTYKMTYTSSPSPSTGRSLLASVQEYGKDAVLDGTGTVIGGTSLPAMTFGYQAMTLSFQQALWTNGWWFGDRPLSSSDASQRYSIGDFNGDGRNDILFKGHNSHLWVALSQGNTFAQSEWTYGWNFGNASTGADASSRFAVADFTGDSKSDVLFKNSDGTMWVATSNGSTFTQANWTNGWFFGQSSVNTFDAAGRYAVGDFNGDGKSDLLYKGYTGDIWVALSTGSSFTQSKWTSSFGSASNAGEAGSRYTVGDFNGDGKSDLLYKDGTGKMWVTLSTGSAFGAAVDWSPEGGFFGLNPLNPTEAGNRYSQGDFNGDGKTDLLYKGTNSSMWVALSTGSKFTQLQWLATFGNASNTTDAASRYGVGEFNGDGRSDLYYKGPDGYMWVARSLGNAFTAANWTSVNFGLNPLSTTEAGNRYDQGDFDGDGKGDLLYKHTDGTMYVALANSPLPDLLTSVSNGMGATTTVQFAPSSAYANTLLPSVMQTVKVVTTTVTTNGGQNKWGRYTYTYQGGKWSNSERRFLGFRYVKTVLDTQGTYQETYNHQSVNSIGKADSTYFRSAGGLTMTYSIFTYAENSTPPYTSLLTQSDEYECNGSTTCRQKRTQLTYDGYGNVTKTDEYGDMAIGGDERTTSRWYIYNTSAYIVSLPAYETVFAGIGTGGTSVALTFYTYDTNTNFGYAPTVGDLKKVERRIDQTGTFATTLMQYDSYGNVIATTDARGYSSTVQYDLAYHLYPIRSCNALNQCTSTDWDYVLGQPTSATDPNNLTTVFAYDALGRKLAQGTPDLPGTAIWVDDSLPAGAVSGYNNDSWTWVTSPTASGATAHRSDVVAGVHQHFFQGATSTLVITVGGTLEQWIYIPSNSAPSEIMLQWLGTDWHRAYWGQNLINWGTDGTNSRRYMGPIPAARDTWIKLVIPASAVGLEGKTISGWAYTLYDGGIVWDASEINNAATWQYVNWGNPNAQYVQQTLPDGSADGLWSRTYTDGLGRTYKVVKEGPSIEGPSMGVTYIQETTYSDASQRPASQSLWRRSDESARWETYTYDAAGRLSAATHPGGGSSTSSVYANDASGKPYVASYDELGHEKVTWNDAYGRLIQVREKNGAEYYTTTYQYDVLGKLLQVQDHAGNTSTMSYDSLGRKLTMNDVDMGGSSYTYDSGGLLLTQTDANGQTIAFTYDALGRVKTKTYPDNSQVQWFYDEAGYGSSIGRLTRSIYPGGSDSHTWNLLGQEVSTTRCIDGVCKTTQQNYDALQRLRTLTYPDGELVTYTYNPAGELSSVSSSTGQNYVTSMMWTAAGRLTTLNYGNEASTIYTYDPNRLWLNSAVVRDSDNNVRYTGIYTYYLTGHVQSMTQGTPTVSTLDFAYDDLNRLTNVSGAQTQSLQYDAIGNLKYNSLYGGVYTYSVRIPPCVGATPTLPHAVVAANGNGYGYDCNGNMISGGGRTYTWDYDNRPTSVTQGGATTSFVYDANGQRIKKTQGTNTNLYFGLTEQINGVWYEYYYAGPILVAKKNVQTDEKIWYHSDRLGSIRLMTGQRGVEVKDYDYKAFGDFQSQSGSEFNERTFTGHIRDAETGLIYMGARYYDAALGRFISADTIIASLANPQSLNRYSYVYNNPINNSDPTGHKACDEQWGCEGKPPQPSQPSKPSTNTNQPGGNNTTPAGAQNAGDTGGNGDQGTGADVSTIFSNSPKPYWHEHRVLGDGMKPIFRWSSRIVYAGCLMGGCTTVDKYHLTGSQAYEMESTSVDVFFGESEGDFLRDTVLGVVIDAGTAGVASPAMSAIKFSQTKTNLSFYHMLQDIGQQDQDAGRLHQPLTVVVVQNTFFFGDISNEFYSTQRQAVYIEYGSNQITPPLFADTWSGLAQNINEAATAAYIAEH
jgi:RHS repeat-associated protein